MLPDCSILHNWTKNDGKYQNWITQMRHLGAFQTLWVCQKCKCYYAGNVNVARYAWNVERDFFCHFETPWLVWVCSSNSVPNVNPIGLAPFVNSHGVFLISRLLIYLGSAWLAVKMATFACIYEVCTLLLLKPRSFPLEQQQLLMIWPWLMCEIWTSKERRRRLGSSKLRKADLAF